MQNDRELLELAAKAAGYVIRDSTRWADTVVRQVTLDDGSTNYVRWNTLTDDGDALRLAVKLRIGLGDRETSVTAFHKQSMSTGAVYIEEFGDPLAATRRAITRAAAEIGKAMP